MSDCMITACADPSARPALKCRNCGNYNGIPSMLMREGVDSDWGYCPCYGGYLCGDDGPEDLIGDDECWEAA